MDIDREMSENELLYSINNQIKRTNELMKDIRDAIYVIVGMAIMFAINLI